MKELNLLTIRNGLVQKRNTIINRLFLIFIIFLATIVSLINIEEKIKLFQLILSIIFMIISILIFFQNFIQQADLEVNISDFDKLYSTGASEEEIIEKLKLLQKNEKE